MPFVALQESMSQQAYMTVVMMSRFCRVINCGRRTLRPGLLHYRNHSHDLQATASCQSVTAFVVLAHSRESSSMICQICDPRARLRLSPGIPWHRDTDPSNRYPPSYKHQILPTLMTCGDSGCIIGSEHGVAIATSGPDMSITMWRQEIIDITRK